MFDIQNAFAQNDPEMVDLQARSTAAWIELTSIVDTSNCKKKMGQYGRTTDSIRSMREAQGVVIHDMATFDDVSDICT